MKTMKVTITALIILCLACGIANAQVSFYSWGRAVITPFAFMGDRSAVSAATSTWGDVPRIGFSANGTAPSGNIGFNIDFDFGINIANNAPGIIGDNAKAWVKPLGLVLPEEYNMLKLTAGFFKEEELRGRIGASEFASWLVYRQSRYWFEWGSPDEDYIFRRFDATAGAYFKLEPLKWMDSGWNGLSIHGAFGSTALASAANNLRATLNLLNNEDNNTMGDVYDENSGEYDGDRKVKASDVFRAMHVAIAYRIPDLGLVRAQFIGNNRNVFRWAEQGGGRANLERKLMTGISTNKDADVIEAAFLLDGLEGLKVDVGVKIPLAYTTKADFLVYPRLVGSDGLVIGEKTNPNKREYTVQLPYVAALGVSWTPPSFSELTVNARVDGTFGGSIISDEEKIKIRHGPIIDAWLMPSYLITDNIRLGVDMGVDIHLRDTYLVNDWPVDEALTDVSEFIDFGIGPWFQLNVGGGQVKVGVVMMKPGSPRYKMNSGQTYYAISPILTGGMIISVPISFTYSF
ncbi:MAG: hypothetical protein LBB72_09720 [Spirochaetaceae bacterium]|jgi:hypothetical protein|nr:hypothetical protein [Spirochaetaceae bacterium]